MRVLNSRKGIQRKPRVLIDTSFLLPAIGISTDREVMEAIKHFSKFEICYLEASLLELSWKILKIIDDNKMEYIKSGLKAIRETYTLVSPSPNAYIQAYLLYKKGHKDFIDNILYFTSIDLNIFLLTIDLELINFLKKNSYPLAHILTPDALDQLLRDAVSE